MDQRKLRWGVIGTGDIVRKRVANAIQTASDCELAAVTSRRFERAAHFAGEFGVPLWFPGVREMVQDDAIDAVYVASPVSLHCEHVVVAAEAGKHVLCEKPMAITVSECDRMIEACRANGVRLGIAYYRRFYPVIERLRRALHSGEIGKTVLVQVNAFEAFEPDPADPRHWFVETAKSGGGPMMDFGCHRIEILLDLFGAIEQVRSLNANVLYDREVEDTSSVTLLFSDGPYATITVTHAARESVDSIDLFGTEGTIRVNSVNSGRISVITAAGETKEDHPPPQNFHAPLIEDFARCVLNGGDPTVTGEAGREVARILDAVYGR